MEKNLSDGLPLPQRYGAIATIIIGISMAVLDGAIANVALPTIASDLHASPASSIWIVNAYQIAIVVSLLSFSFLGDMFGYRRVYQCGLVVFTFTSLFCAFSDSLHTLTLARIAQGFGGAALMSVNTALIRLIYPQRHLGRGMGINSFIVAVSSAAGPTIAAAILSVASWQWLFAINLIPGSIALLLAWRALPRESVADRSPFDAPGAVLSAVLLGSAIMLADSLQHVAQHISLQAVFWGVLALVSALAFTWRIRRAQHPLLPPVMFRNGRFTLAALTSLASFVSQGITFVALPFLFQSVYGYSPVVSALLFTPWPIGIVLIAPHAGRWADTISAPLISTLGLMVFVGGLVLLATLPENPSAWNICLRSLVCGMGFGCFQSPNNREMLANVAREYASYASGVLSIVRTFGQCLGAAVVGVLLGAAAGWDHQHAIQVALWLAVIASMGSVVFSLSRLRPAVRASA